jgi:DNA-binding NtrC family response regulator
MPPLLHDRYLMINATDACDLATGAVASVEALVARRESSELTPPALLEMLDHGRDGSPRAVVADLASTTRLKVMVDRIAGAAVERGYVPIDVGLYARMRPVLEEEIAHRTLVLIASDRSGRWAGAALLDAAARTPRPHVLLTLRTSRTAAGPVVREARAAYGGVTRSRPVVPLSSDVLQYLQRARRAPEFIALGRHAAAARLLREVAAALMRRSAWSQAVTVSISLGRLLLERGRPLDAVTVFGDATAAAATAGDELLAAEARIWLATARTDAGELTAAESVCRSLLLVGGLPASFAAWTRAALVRVFLWQDRVRDASGVGAMACPALAGLDPETEAFIRSTEIRLLLRMGHVFEAGLQASQLWTATRTATALCRVIGATSHLRVLAAAGDLVSCETRLREVSAAAREARTPLRLLRARYIWSEALRRAGRTKDADRELRAVSRVGRAAPMLVRHAIERQQRAQAEPTLCPDSAGPGRIRETELSPAVLIGLAQDEEDDGLAIERLLEATAHRLHSTRLDLWSADAGPSTIVRTAGRGLPTTIGTRVIDAGITIRDGQPSSELGVPVRLGSRLVGALVARWPIDRLPPVDAMSLLELVAAVAAPRIDALLYRARTEAEAATLIPELVGVSRAMADVRQAVARAAAAPFSVLIEGESGVGKELIARAVHYLSPRRERRFCDVNGAALPDDLIESELFGHAKGAFTGAVVERAGLFEDANGGTLFLDEIADLSLRAQAKLLRVLQQQEIRRVGETFARPVDVRLVSAANRDMRVEAAQGRFRQDLLYRIDVIRIDVPALRERPEDIPALAVHFWRTAAERVGTTAVLSPATLAALSAYQWPGNVRELQNVIAGVAVGAPRRGQVNADMLPAVISRAMPIRTSRLVDARSQFERRFVEAALARAGGNRAKAARALGLSRQGLLKMLERLHVDP